jgi:hypothetical protein
VRAAIYKIEMGNPDCRELEFAREDSRIGEKFVKIYLERLRATALTYFLSN